RNQRWCHHDAVVPQPGQQTVKSISARTGFVAEVEATPMLAKPSNHFAQDDGAVLEYANLSYLPTAAALGNRHANRRLVHIQSDVCDIVHQARPPCLRLCAGNPAQPWTLVHAEDGPPITQRTSGLAQTKLAPNSSS